MPKIPLIQRWGGLATFPIPAAIFDSNGLRLKGRELSVVLLVYQQLKNRKRNTESGSVKISQRKIGERTGLSSPTSVSKAVQRLQELRLIDVVPERKGKGRRIDRKLFGVNRYVALNPKTGLPFLHIAGESLIHGNGLPYFQVPVCVTMETGAEWSMAQMSSTQLCVYVAILSFANWEGSEFQVSAAILRKRSGVRTTRTFRAAIEELEHLGLIQCSRSREDVYSLRICDPYTGELPHVQTGDPTDDPANYFIRQKKGVDKQFNFNDAYRDPEYVERLIQSCLPEGAKVGRQSNGYLKVPCPFHDDHNPSGSVNPAEQWFHCFTCGQTWRITDFVMKARSLTEPQAHAYKRQMLGNVPEYHRRKDKNAIIYNYIKNGKLIYQKLRFPDTVSADGSIEKHFSMRRPGRGGGWTNKVSGEEWQPVLYNHDSVKNASIVFITEGEKDADRVLRMIHDSNINPLPPYDGWMLAAITTGSANSWADELAEHLRGKQIVILPDADDNGASYRDKIAASLDARLIARRVVEFSNFGAKDFSEWIDAGHDAEEFISLVNEAATINGEPGPLLCAGDPAHANAEPQFAGIVGL